MDEPQGSQKPMAAQPPPTPAWVKALAAILVVIIVIAVIVVVSGVGGPHGPLRHFPGAT